ncbi:MAG: hypothetical protein GMKNLPBB_01376 [Myxococcota bacterium]|nr:hypothetical protein [Myxococcota bacterium]
MIDQAQVIGAIQQDLNAGARRRRTMWTFLSTLLIAGVLVLVKLLGVRATFDLEHLLAHVAVPGMAVGAAILSLGVAMGVFFPGRALMGVIWGLNTVAAALMLGIETEPADSLQPVLGCFTGVWFFGVMWMLLLGGAAKASLRKRINVASWLAASATLAALLILDIHCPNQSPAHLWISHGGGAAAFLLVAGLLSRAFRRRKTG